MTNELKKQFFDTFGIEPRLDCKRCGAKNFALGQCWEVNCEKSYPQITDRILLELICNLSGVCCLYFPFKRDIPELEGAILKLCIAYKHLLKQQIQRLFKEE